MNAPDESCIALAARTPPQDFYHLAFSGPANSLMGAFRLRYLAPLCIAINCRISPSSRPMIHSRFGLDLSSASRRWAFIRTLCSIGTLEAFPQRVLLL